MSAILEEGIGFGGNAKITTSPQSTDELIQSYENKLTQSIALKTLEASKKGVAANFTKEELAYLNKKVQADIKEEISVITPSPIISLKKGKTEIQVKNAAQIFQKMDEKYPLGTSDKNDVVDPDGKMRERFTKMVNFDVRNVSPQVSESVTIEEKPLLLPKSEPVCSEPTQKSVAEDKEWWTKYPKFPTDNGDIKTVNKNAYEIRADVLSMALDFIRWQTERADNIPGHLSEVVKSDIVLDVATKFYKFVENRR